MAKRLSDICIQIVSLVKNPANAKGCIIKSIDAAGQAQIEIACKIVRKDELRGLVYVCVYPANEVDLQGDFADEVEVEKAAQFFMEMGLQRSVDLGHSLKIGEGVLVESGILGGPDDRYPGISKGSWVACIKVFDKAKLPEIQGASMYGTAGASNALPPTIKSKSMPELSAEEKAKLEKEAADKTAADNKTALEKAAKDAVEKAVKENTDANAARTAKEQEDEKQLNLMKSLRFFITKSNSAALKSWRRASKVSEQDMADALGISLDEYLLIEDGQAEATFTGDTLKAIAKLAKADPLEFAAMLASGTPADATPATPDAGAGGTSDNTIPQGGTVPAAKSDDETGDDKTKVIKQTTMPEDKSKARSTQVKTVAVEDTTRPIVAKDTREQLYARQGAVAKSFAGFTDEGVKLLQKGIIGSTSIAPASTLLPAQAKDVISLVRDQDPSGFLKRISFEPMSKINSPVLVADVASRIIVRRAPGAWPVDAENNGLINKSIVMTGKKCNAQFMIDNETLMEWKDDVPGLEAKIYGMFIQTLRNNILDLAFNGLTDSSAATETSFTALGIGWHKLLLDKLTAAGLTSQIIDISDDAANLQSGSTNLSSKIWAKMFKGIASGNQKFFPRAETAIITGTTDIDQFEEELTARTDGASFIINGSKDMTFRRRKLEEIPFLASGYNIYTQLSNLILGMVTGSGMEGGITVQRLEVAQALQYIITFYVDMEVISEAAAIISKP